MTTATPTTADLRYTRVRDDVAPGATAYHVWQRVLPQTWARVPGVRVYTTGTRRVLRWRATLTRGAYATRHEAACAALAQGSPDRHAPDATVPAAIVSHDHDRSAAVRAAHAAYVAAAAAHDRALSARLQAARRGDVTDDAQPAGAR